MEKEEELESGAVVQVGEMGSVGKMVLLGVGKS